MRMHYILQQLDYQGTCTRIFVDFSLALISIITEISPSKLIQLTVPDSPFQGIISFLIGRKPQVRLWDVTSGMQTVSTCAVFSHNCFSPSTPMTAPQITQLSNLCNLQMIV